MNAAKRLRVAQFGLGPIGLESVKLAATKSFVEVVGGVDVDPAKVGRTLAELTGLPALAGARVYATAAELLAATGVDVVLHTAASSAAASLAQLRPFLEAGLAAASTCEELIFPALRHAAAAAEADALCRRTGARVVAAGVNPGFVMDVLPLCLSGVAREVRRVTVHRVVDASTRRQPLQAKVGSGLPPEEFIARFHAGKAGHAGLRESVALLAHGLGWPLDDVREDCEPVVAAERITTAHFDILPGQTAGLHQTAVGRCGGEDRIFLDLQMFQKAPDPRDEVVLESTPPLRLVIPGGTAGDGATVASLLNSVPRLLALGPGLHLPTDLPLPRCFA